MSFTRLDRNLLGRVAGHLKVAAGVQDAKHRQAVEKSNFALAKVAKADADRVHRDLRDLTALQKRLEVAFPESMRPVPAVLADSRLGEE